MSNQCAAVAGVLLQGCAVDDVIAVIVKSGGPENNGTQAEAVKWHDDKVGDSTPRVPWAQWFRLTL